MSKRIRSIYFYTLKGYNTFTGQAREEVDLIEILKDIDKLSHKEGIQGRYLNAPGIPELSLQEITFNKNRCMGKIGFRRTHDLPYKENSGKETPLVLDPGECLFEPTHFILFNNKVLGIEYNHHGPKASNLRVYIERKGIGSVSQVELAFLIKPDVMKKLKKLKVLTSIKIKVEQSGLQALRILNADLPTAAETMFDINKGVDTIEFTLNATPRKKDRGFKIPGFFTNIPKALKDENSDGISKFEIKGIDTNLMKTDEVNILSDKIISKKTVDIETNDHSYIDSTDMYQKILEAYNDNKDDIISSIRGIK